MHGLLAERAQEPKREQVQIAVDKPVQSHELRLSVLTCLMLHYLLANLVEARILGQVGYVAVHLSVHLDVLYDVSAVSLQTTVEVMQVLDAANFSCRGVEEFSGNGF